MRAGRARANPGEADLGFAVVDLDREARTGQPETIYGAGKTPAEVAAIAGRLRAAGQRVLATRVDETHVAAVRKVLPEAVHHPRARCLTVGARRPAGRVRVGIVCAGTCDLPVAEECLVAVEFFGFRARIVADVGVAGLHRLLGRIPELRRLEAIVVVAGMEGALPSVVTGVVACPVVAVPTSVGYGVGAGGFAALAGMLTSCASGLAVVNIDNGFGAAAAIARILRARH